MRRATWLGTVCLGILLSGLAGCNTAPGPEPLDLRPPVLSDFSFSPHTIILDRWPEEQIDENTVSVPLDLSVRATDPDGTIEEVAYIVQSPLTSTQPVAEGTLTPGEDGRYTAAETITISRGAIGTYTILVYAVDDDRLLSGEVRGGMRFIATGEPPVIEAIEVPESVQRPAPGDPPITFQYIVTVSDPDGQDNISRVEVELGDIGTFQLCDDGSRQPCGTVQNSGDATAGDGRYTITFEINSNNQPDTYLLRFKAIDRTGLESDVVERTFQIL